jgi:predicted nucleotide-binding protein (sugar kinase/HSP70/actin superfamily)
VAAAFATLLDREIIVPPHNGIMGAIGAALLARDGADSVTGTSASPAGSSVENASGKEASVAPRPTRFRGWDIESVPRSLREFTCTACSNRCAIQEFTVAGEKSHWGDKCSDRYRKRTRTNRKPVVSDLVRFREKLIEPFLADGPRPASPRGRAGVPLALFFHDRLPFWKTYLQSLGFETVFSGATDREKVSSGVEACVNEPCFPVQAAHGHLVGLMELNPDFVFFPNTVNEEDPLRSVASFLCPWVQTFPLVAGHVQALESFRGRIECPTVQFRDGMEQVERSLYRQMSGRRIRPGEHRSAVRKAFEAQEAFRRAILGQGAAALKTILDADAPAVVLAGRPYNLYDSGMNLNIPGKLTEIYGANVIPMDFLPIDSVDIRPVNDHMFWNYGRRILQAAAFVRPYGKIQIIYLSNFKCGPDSYIRHYVEEAAGRPFLFLQLDSHSNDAGVMTRIEAFLESKGMI